MNILGIDPSINSSAFTLLNIDDEYNIISHKHVGFSKKKKDELHSDNLHICLIDKYYGDYEYHHRCDIIISEVAKYIDFSKIDYIGIEDYSFGSVGNTFDIAEFVGGMKQLFYTNNILFKKYPPSSVKQFATGKGSGDKIPMGMAYNKLIGANVGIVDHISELPDYTSPKADMVDSFWIALLLKYELEQYSTNNMKNKYLRSSEALEAILGGKKKKKTLPTIAHPIIKPVKEIIPFRNVD